MVLDSFWPEDKVPIRQPLFRLLQVIYNLIAIVFFFFSFLSLSSRLPHCCIDLDDPKKNVRHRGVCSWILYLPFQVYLLECFILSIFVSIHSFSAATFIPIYISKLMAYHYNSYDGINMKINQKA